jgi:hypothetical protein
LEKKKEFSFRTRGKIDELIEEFLDNIKDDIYDMFCENELDEDYREEENRYDNYRGLDSDRDTEEEVETTLRCFPELLSENYALLLYLPYMQDGNRDRVICNLKAVSFIPLVARLSIEFGFFQEVERGGLILFGHVSIMNVLLELMNSAVENQEHHELADDKYLLVVKKLRQMGLLKKEDIQKYGLLVKLCCQGVLAEKRLRFLIEWDPTALIQPICCQSSRLYDSSLLYIATLLEGSMQTFRIVFEYGIRYYPNRKGISLLFKKNCVNETPFQSACESYGRNEVMRIIEEILIRYSSSDNSTPLNVAEALIIAAIDEHVHLDCVYFLLRRQPDVLTKLLSGSSTFPASASASGGDANGNNNARDSSKKRKKSNTTAIVIPFTCAVKRNNG